MGLPEEVVGLVIPAGLSTSEGTSSSAENIDLTPENSSEEDRGLRYDDDDDDREEGGRDEERMPADPLLRARPGQEVYELREGPGGRRRRPDQLDLGGGYYDSAPGDGAGDEERGSADVNGEYLGDVLLYTADEESAVVRKFDRRLVLFVALLYLLSFLDRSSMCLSPFLASFPPPSSFSPSPEFHAFLSFCAHDGMGGSSIVCG